eukprot:3383849-Lingulodinium_polyedra.AAC.1
MLSPRAPFHFTKTNGIRSVAATPPGGRGVSRRLTSCPNSSFSFASPAIAFPGASNDAAFDAVEAGAGAGAGMGTSPSPAVLVTPPTAG